MWERLTNWLSKTIALKPAMVILAFCMLFAASFAFGAVMGRNAVVNSPRQSQPPPPIEYGEQFVPPPRGTFGAIDAIQGDQIQLRDPRSGRTWVVRARRDTVIEFGPRRRIPFDNLRVGQRIFVVGVPNDLNSPNEFDAQFIGVVLGQQQRYVRPAVEPMECWDCVD